VVEIAGHEADTTTDPGCAQTYFGSVPIVVASTITALAGAPTIKPRRLNRVATITTGTAAIETSGVRGPPSRTTLAATSAWTRTAEVRNTHSSDRSWCRWRS
jgi:hypothetical protein